MGERREIAAGADRTFLGNHRCDVRARACAIRRFDEQRAAATVTYGEHVGAQQQQGARFTFGKRLAQTTGMTAHQIQLQFAKLRVASM